MFNLNDKTQTDRIQIIGDNQHTRIANMDHTGWGIGFEASGQRKGTAEKQKQNSTKNQFRVRIYDVY